MKIARELPAGSQASDIELFQRKLFYLSSVIYDPIDLFRV